MENAVAERFKMLPNLQEACKLCRMCELGWQEAERGVEKYNPHIFSNYKPSYAFPKFMIVGQNPGWQEVVHGEPFVGPSGENFDNALKQTMWERNDFYITNALKCYTKDNAAPTQRQLSRCEPFLRMELEIIKPVLVVAFGASAFSVLCPNSTFSENIGKIVRSDKFDVKVFTTYHPSPRNMISEDRRIQFDKDVRNLGLIMNKYTFRF